MSAGSDGEELELATAACHASYTISTRQRDDKDVPASSSTSWSSSDPPLFLRLVTPLSVLGFLPLPEPLNTDEPDAELIPCTPWRIASGRTNRITIEEFMALTMEDNGGSLKRSTNPSFARPPWESMGADCAMLFASHKRSIFHPSRIFLMIQSEERKRERERERARTTIGKNSLIIVLCSDAQTRRTKKGKRKTLSCAQDLPCWLSVSVVLGCH